MMTINELEEDSGRGVGIWDAGDELRDYVYNLSEAYMRIGDEQRAGIVTSADVEERKKKIQKDFKTAIGWDFEGMDTPKARITGVVSKKEFSIEKILYCSRDGVWVSSLLYLPAHSKGPCPAVLFVCGHDPDGKNSSRYQNVCMQLLSYGFVVFAIDSYGQGERSSYYEPQYGRELIGRCTREHDYAGFQCMMTGESTAKYLLHDAVRALDYLVTRPEVDRDKIGVTGNSGGGTLTMMLMMTEKRLAAAACGTFVTSRRSYLRSGQAQDNEQVWPGMTKKGFDHEDGLLCMAPKPVLILSVQHDFFPPQGTLDTFHNCQRYWELYGKRENIELFVDDSMHDYTIRMADRAGSFFKTALYGNREVGRVCDPRAYDLSREDLHATRSGYVRIDEKSKGIFEENLQQYDKCEQKRDQIPSGIRKADAVAYLNHAIFDNRTECPFYLRKTQKTKTVLDICCDSYLWKTQEHMVNHGFLFYKPVPEPVGLPVTIALWDQGTLQLKAHFDIIRKYCDMRRAVLVLDIRGTGRVAQREWGGYAKRGEFYSATYKLNADLLWLDDSCMALGIYDLIKAIAVVKEIPMLDGSRVDVYTYGRYNAYAEIAALMDPHITSVQEDAPLESYKKLITSRYYDPYDIASFVMPKLLHYCDLDELKKWRMENESSNQ